MTAGRTDRRVKLAAESRSSGNRDVERVQRLKRRGGGSLDGPGKSRGQMLIGPTNNDGTNVVPALQPQPKHAQSASAYREVAPGKTNVEALLRSGLTSVVVVPVRPELRPEVLGCQI
jgi:hypothetical protein